MVKPSSRLSSCPPLADPTSRPLGQEGLESSLLGKNQKGFAFFEVILFLVLAGIIGFAGWQVWQSRKNANSAYDNLAATQRQDFSTSRIIAVSDVACDPGSIYLNTNDPNHCQSKATASLLESLKPDAILAIGDLQYEDGEYDKFMASYDKNWGKYKAKTYPVPGNHEYGVPWASGYFKYFNEDQTSGRAGESGKGYYAVNIGSWNIIALNSNCGKVGGCGEGSAQYDWLKQNLLETSIERPNSCSLAFWHHPRFTSGRYGADTAQAELSIPFWNLLQQYKADVVLNGHDHLYERFAPSNTDGSTNPSGLRQFTSGAGGKSLYKQTAKQPNSEKLIDDRFGVLVLDLLGGAYSWQFVATNGEVLDSGSQSCV